MPNKSNEKFKYQKLRLLQNLSFASKLVVNSFFGIIFAALFLTISPSNLRAREIPSEEIRASWIYVIAEWLEWKDHAKNKKFPICAIGRDKVYMHLKRIKSDVENKKGRQFFILNKATNDDLKECRILYISESEQEYYMNILSTAQQAKGVITISSIKGFANHGGSIEFVIRTKAHLVLNSQSFKNAQVLIDEDLLGWVEMI